MSTTGTRVSVSLAAGALLPLAACLPAEKPGFESANPSQRLGAIVEASSEDADPSTLRDLVEQLDSQDPAARMLAIRALERRTGTTQGYIHTDPEWRRQQAIDRWLKYLESGGLDRDLPSSAGGQSGVDPMES